MKIVNSNSRVINKLETSLTANDRVIIYDHHTFIVKATVVNCTTFFTLLLTGKISKNTNTG
jgi:nanoRNase/pAp phosphatase (c-di-AMP/oligoRNAs hydrolase)